MGCGGQAQSAGPPDLRAAGYLSSWKEIAAYLDTSIRTVQRWEQAEGLPVHRHQHTSGATVYAYASELDAWLGCQENQFERDVGVLASRKAVLAPTRLIVLPFRLIRPDPEIEYLSFCLADAVTASLTGRGSLVLRSSLVAARYTSETDLQRIAREAAVDMILTGTLLRSGCELRMNVQLVEAASGTVVSSKTERGNLQNVFELQDRLAGRIVDILGKP